ncbi:unnamed protein product [Trichogramma brassicae]|uniref:CCHC-type domain-containing protein n=1 Tax=Trichogramma brassicae TaxID=86971 RepID=A0A6H5J2D4_9HYME|nr:unnamed protein product [Trichogramma brassicae]
MSGTKTDLYSSNIVVIASVIRQQQHLDLSAPDNCRSDGQHSVEFTIDKTQSCSSAKDASTYADILRTLKSDPTLQQSVGSSVQNIRRSAAGALVLQLKKNLDNAPNLGAELNKAPGDTVTASALQHTTIIEIRDLNECATKEEIAEALGTSLVAPGLNKKVIRTLRKAYAETQVAVTALPDDLATKALKLGHIQIGWVNCRIGGREDAPRCYRCWRPGHVSARCKGPDCSGHCFRCGQAGHQIKDCKNNPTQAAIWVQGNLVQEHPARARPYFTWARISGIYFFSVYAPPRLADVEFSALLTNITEEARRKRLLIVAGDFNTWSTKWGCRATRQRATTLLDALAPRSRAAEHRRYTNIHRCTGLLGRRSHLRQRHTRFSSYIMGLYLWTSEIADLRRSCLRARRLAQRESIVGQMKMPAERAMPPQGVSCTLLSRPASAYAGTNCATRSTRTQEQLYQPLPWRNYEKHTGGSRSTLHLERIKYHTPLSRSPSPRTLTSSCRCTRRACGPVSFPRAGKDRGSSCCQSQASPPKNHRRTGRSVCLTQRARFWEESSVTASKPLLGALGASQNTSTAFRRKAIAGKRWNRGTKEYCTVVTLDVKNASNSAQWSNIHAAQRQMRTSEYLLRIIRSYLSERLLDCDADDGIESHRVTARVCLGAHPVERHVRRRSAPQLRSQRAPIWGCATETQAYIRQAEAVHRRACLRVISGQPHVSYDATYVIASVHPLALLADERARIYQRRPEDVKEEERREALSKWQDRVKTRCLVTYCECGSRFCRRPADQGWQVTRPPGKLHFVSVVFASGAIMRHVNEPCVHASTNEAPASGAIFGTHSTSGTGSTTPGETRLENSPSGDRTHALRHTLYQEARTIPTEPRRPVVLVTLVYRECRTAPEVREMCSAQEPTSKCAQRPGLYSATRTARDGVGGGGRRCIVAEKWRDHSEAENRRSTTELGVICSARP